MSINSHSTAANEDREVTTFDLTALALRRVSAMRFIEDEFVRRYETSKLGTNCACDALRQTLELCTTGVPPPAASALTDEGIARALAEHEERLRDFLTAALIQQQLLVQSGELMVHLMRAKRRATLVSVFDPLVGADDTAAGDAESSACSVIGETCGASKRTLRMRCCSATICVDCLTEHTLLGASADNSSANCVFCRAPYSLCRPATPSPPPSPPTRSTGRSSYHGSPQRAF